MEGGIEIEAEIELAVVKIEQGAGAVKAEAASLALDGGVGGVHALVEGIGEFAVPVTEDAVGALLQGACQRAHGDTEVGGGILAEAADPADEGLEP